MILTLVYRILRSPESAQGARPFAWIASVTLGLAWLLGWGLLILGFQLGLLIAYVTATVVLYSALAIVVVLTALLTSGTHPVAN